MNLALVELRRVLEAGREPLESFRHPVLQVPVPAGLTQVLLHLVLIIPFSAVA